MLFKDADVVGAQHYNCKLAALQILLVFEALIRCDHDRKPVNLSGLQELAVDKARPTLLRCRQDLMPYEIRPKLIRDILIEQNAQAARFRRTVLRP